jgi:hypothetical protein
MQRVLLCLAPFVVLLAYFATGGVRLVAARAPLHLPKQDGSWIYPMYNATVVREFSRKRALNAIPMSYDPYQNVTAGDCGAVHAPRFCEPSTVCGLKYVEKSRDEYTLTSYATAAAARADDAHVTHLTACGACSTTKDLAVYMAQIDLTKPVRACALKGIVSKQWAHSCLVDIGFSPACADIWYYNTRNTREHCLAICLKWINKLNNLPPNSTTLNPWFVRAIN